MAYLYLKVVTPDGKEKHECSYSHVTAEEFYNNIVSKLPEGSYGLLVNGNELTHAQFKETLGNLLLKNGDEFKIINSTVPVSKVASATEFFEKAKETLVQVSPDATMIPSNVVVREPINVGDAVMTEISPNEDIEDSPKKRGRKPKTEE